MTEIIPFADRLDADHRKMLEMIPDDLLDVAALDRMRERTDALMVASAGRQTPVPGIRIDDVVVPAEGDRPDLRLRFYIPERLDAPAPLLLYIHGGGYVSTKMTHYDAQCSQIADGADIMVASIDYRLAPEHPYPIPVEDSYAALAWLHWAATAHGFDPQRIGVGGTSAGAGLAAGVALLARDRGDYPVAFQYLEAPMLDHRNVTASSHEIDCPKIWNRKVNQRCWEAYLGADHLERDIQPYASPAIAEDLSGLPPTYLCVAAFDLFLDETIDYGRRLLLAGVSVQLNVFEMGFHGSPRMIPTAPVSIRWKADALAALRRLSAPTPKSPEAQER